MDALKELETLLAQGSLRSIDYYFADFIRRASGTDDRGLLLAAALVSRSVGDSHICVELEPLAGRVYPPSDLDETEFTESGLVQIELPAWEAWKQSLESDAARIVVGSPGDEKPLILDEQSRLYMRRYWAYEHRVARAIREMAEPLAEPEWPPDFGKRLHALFDSPVDRGGDRQRLAAFLALRNRLTLISGGPGTGKTFTVARILALLVDARRAAGAAGPLRIELAAPTGKAAARMGESIRQALDSLALSAGSRAMMPDAEPATLHRLLGTVPGSPYFRRDADRPLDADVVIVDEASMIDLPMMAKLLDALHPASRLILLGDMNQLASVEPGYVFGDICTAATPDVFAPEIKTQYERETGIHLEDPGLAWTGGHGISDCMVELSYSHRFRPDSDIGTLSAAINTADTPAEADATWALLQTVAGQGDVTWVDAPVSTRDGRHRPNQALRHAILEGYRPYLDAATVPEMFEAVKRYRILCATRSGRYGVDALNAIAEDVLSARDIELPLEQRPRHLLHPAGEFYPRRLVMVTTNDYALRLFNGDIGIIMPGPEAATDARKLYAYFETVDASGTTGVRAIPANMLPAHETAFAMTVHKSQGSEFGRVMLLLPPGGNRVITRELIYTGVTRTRQYVDLWCSEQGFKQAVVTRTERSSGLREKLRSP